MINHKILEALEKVDTLIKEELKNCSVGSFPSGKDILRQVRDKVQEAITAILKGAQAG